MNIGRLDPASASFPEVDLTSDGGLEKGVSRRHAKITRRGSEVFIEDLGSINGTFLNRIKLMPYFPQELKSGDELQLGKLIIRVGSITLDRDLEVVSEEQELYIQRGIDRLFTLQEEELYCLECTPDERESLSRLVTRIIGQDADIRRISDLEVLGHHCRIFAEDNQFFIEDSGSTSSVFLNGDELSPGTKRPLHHGDSIRIETEVFVFHDQIAALLTKLSEPREKKIAIRSIKMNCEQNCQVALRMLAKLMETAMKDTDHDTIGEVALAIRDVTTKQPLAGINLLLQVTKPGEKYVHRQVYRTLGDLMAQEERILLQSLETLTQRSGEHSLPLLYRISREKGAGPFKSFLEACTRLFSHADYTETDFERLIGMLRRLSEGVEARDLLLLHQTFLDLLSPRTVSEISAFCLPDLSGRDDIPLTHVMNFIEQLVEVSSLTQKSALVEDAGDKLYYLTQALSAVDKVKGEISAKLREPERALCFEILSRWRDVISVELGRLRGRAVLQVELLTRQAFPREQVTLTLKLSNTGAALAENVKVILESLDDYEVIEGHPHDLVGIPAKRNTQVEFTVYPKRDDRMRVEALVIWDDSEHKQKRYRFADQISFVKVKDEFTHIPNPYVAGTPITSPKVFFGRQDVFDFVLENLMSTEQKNTLVLHGQRRTGKSSVLLQLRDRILPQEFIPVYINMEALPDVKTLDAFLARLAYEIDRAARRRIYNLEAPGIKLLRWFLATIQRIFGRKPVKRIPELNIGAAFTPQSDMSFSEQPAMTFDRFMDAVEDTLPGQLFVVMFDEFELIESKITQGMDAGVLSYFRNLMQHRDSLIFVFTGTHRLQEMTHDYWSIFFSIALNREISFLEEEAIRQLITEPVKENLEYDDLTIEKIIRVTCCQPYLVQLICWQLVNYLNGQKRNYATINDLNKVLDQTLVTAEAYFNNIWEQSTSHQRLALALLATLVYPGKETATLSEIERGLVDRGAAVTSQELIAALNKLCRHDVLEERTNGELRYRFQIDLVRMWVEKNKPLSRVLIEEGL